MQKSEALYFFGRRTIFVIASIGLLVEFFACFFEAYLSSLCAV